MKIQKSTAAQVWGLRILSMIIAIIIALVFYVRFYQTFLGDWASAAWAALAVSIGSVIVTGYAIAAFKLDMTSWKNRIIFATLWIFSIGLFIFDRATESYTMLSKKNQNETDATNKALQAIDDTAILKARLAAIQDANRKLADISKLDSLADAAGKTWRYITMRREATRARHIADSLYHLERSRQIETIQAQHASMQTAGIEGNGLGFIVKKWPSAALGAIIIGLLVAAYWKETENPELAGPQRADVGSTPSAAPDSFDFIMPRREPDERKREYALRIAQMYARKEFPEYVNGTYLAGRLGINNATFSKLVHGKLGKTYSADRKQVLAEIIS